MGGGGIGGIIPLCSAATIIPMLVQLSHTSVATTDPLPNSHLRLVCAKPHPFVLQLLTTVKAVLECDTALFSILNFVAGGNFLFWYMTILFYY